MDRIVNVTCPYCGRLTEVKIQNDFISKFITVCDSCDRDFVVRALVSVSTTCFKIEGGEVDG